ncbi:MAG: tetratricopeptide repeat protein [Paludibacteraceae bacterium]|nr:tetratricopeptide repeat protein [Paludibacteraceae bacterium]
MDSEKLEIIAVRKIEEYIGNCPRLELSIQFNDETPIWDEDIIVYSNEKNKSLESFVGRIPVQIKGVTNIKDDVYSIDRNYLKAWATDKGGFFFIVQEDLKTYEPLRVLYALISLNDLDALLRQNSKTVNIQLEELHEDDPVFEEQVVDFARKRNELEISSFDPKDLIPLKEDCEKLRQYININSISPNQREYFSQLLSFIVEENFNLRDFFIQNIQGILEIAQSVKIDDYALLRDISTKFAHFLKVQKRYVLAEKYLKVAKNYAQSLAEKHPEAIIAVNESVENLVKLYEETVVPRPEQKEQPLHLQSCETNPTNYLDLARDYYNLAYRFFIRNRQSDAEKHFINALDLYILLVETGEEEAKKHIKKILDILDKLHEIHKYFRNYIEVERDVCEAKRYLRKSDVLDSGTNQIRQANWLAKSAFLNKTMNRFEDAKREYLKSLRIYDSLRGKNKKNDTIIEKTQIKISLADLYSRTGKHDKARKLLIESIETYDSLIAKNEKIRPYKIKALYEFAKCYTRINEREEAISKYSEAYKLQKELNNQDDFAINQTDTLIALASMCQQGDLKEARKTYKKALDILRRFVKKDPEANIYILMDFLNNSTTIYNSFSSSKDNAKIFLKGIESKYKDLLKMCKEQEKSNQIIYKEVREVLLNCLAHLYDITGDHESAKEEYKELLDLRHEIAKLKPDKDKDVALTLIDLGKLYSIHSSSSSDFYEAVNYYKAVNYYEEALKIFQDLSRDGNNLDNDRATLHNILSNLYYSRNLRSEAESHYKHYLELTLKEQAKNHEFFTEILDNSTLVNTSSHEYLQIISKYEKSK